MELRPVELETSPPAGDSSSKYMKLSCYLLPAVDLTDNTQRYYKIHFVLSPVCTVATVVKAMLKSCNKMAGA